MAQLAIEGKNVLLEALRDNGAGLYEYVPFACATSVDFYYDTEMIEKATVGMAGFRGFEAGLGEWGLTLNTVTHAVFGNNAYTVFDTLLQSLRKNGLDIRLTFEDNSANLQVITGHVLIPHTGISSPVDGFSEDDIELKGDGAFALTTSIVNPPSHDFEVKKLEYYSVGGEQQLTFSDLIGRTILYMGRDGIGRDEINIGNPTDKQFYFNPTLGTIYFYNPGSMTGYINTLKADEWVLILYK